MFVFFYNKEETEDNEFDWFFQVSSEEEQEKPGNFIQGKPRMSLVRRKNNALQKKHLIHSLYTRNQFVRFGATDTLGSHVRTISYDTLM